MSTSTTSTEQEIDNVQHSIGDGADMDGRDVSNRFVPPYLLQNLIDVFFTVQSINIILRLTYQLTTICAFTKSEGRCFAVSINTGCNIG